MQETYLINNLVKFAPDGSKFVQGISLLSINSFLSDNLWIYHILLVILLSVSFILFYHLQRIRRKSRFIDKLKRSQGPLAPQNLLRSIIDTIPGFIYIKDSESRIIVASKYMAHMMGVENPDKLRGKTDHDYYSRELADEFRKNEIAIMASGEPILNKVEKITDSEGETIWLDTTKLPLRDDDGKIVGIVGIGRDITKTKKFEDELRHKTEELNEANILLEERQEEILQQQEELRTQSELVDEERRYLRTLIDNVPDRIYIKDRESRFIVGNKHVARVMGADNPEQLTGKTDFDFYKKELAEGYYRDEQELMSKGESIINKEEKGLDGDGEIVVVSTTKVPFFDENGEVIGVVGIGRDITPQKEVEKKLREKSEMLQEVNVLLEERQEEVQQQAEELQVQAEHLTKINVELEKLSLVASRTDNVIVIMDGEGNFEWVNEGFVKRYNMSLEEFCAKRGKNLRETSHNPDINRIMDEVLSQKKSAIYNAKRKNDEGETIWSQTTISPVTDENGKVIWLIAIDSDISKLKHAEEQINKQKQEIEKNRDELKKLNATKDKFFSIIAHDLKNPFHSIIGFSDLLSRSYDSIEKDKQLEFIKMIKDSSTSAYALLENLLNWARTQTNRIQFNPVKFNIDNLIRDNFQMMNLHAENKGVSLTSSENGKYNVYADFNMVNTIMRNLVSNAIKFTNEGGLVTIETKKNEDRVYISVKDNGVGISDEDLAKLFKLDSFHSTTGTIGEAGTGLGLIVCKDFIERHGGRIEVVSKVGDGSTFRFSLPLHVEEKENEQVPVHS